MATAAATACCSATVLLLATVIFTSRASCSEQLMAAQATDHSGDGGKSDILPVNQDSGEDAEKIKAGKRRGEDSGEVASLAPSEEEGMKVGSGWWAKAKKLYDDKSDSDSDSESDRDHDSDSSSDSDSDSESDDDEVGDDDNSRYGKKEAPGGKHGNFFMKQ